MTAVVLFSIGLTLPRVVIATKAKSNPKPNTLSITADFQKAQLTREDATMVSFELSLTLHFVNDGSKPVLIFVHDGERMNRYPLAIAETLSISPEDASKRRYVYVGGASPAADSLDWKSTQRTLEQAPLPPECIVGIEPGQSWDRAATVGLYIERNGNFDKSSKPWDTIRKVDRLWLQLSFQMWPNNLELNMLDPKFGRELQARWRERGQLFLDNLVSRPIPVSLPH